MSAPKHTAHPLDGAFVTTVSRGHADHDKRSATLKTAFMGNAPIARMHAAEDYLKSLVKADRSGADLLDALVEMRRAFCDPMTRRALGGHNEQQMSATLKATAAIAKATGEAGQ